MTTESTSESVLREDVPLDLRLSDEELTATRERIVGFVSEFVADAGADGAVIGLSGGIDSTTVAYLAVEALGADRVRGLVMPSSVTDATNTTDGERVARELGIAHDVIDVQPIVDAVLSAYPDGDVDERVATDPERTAVGNVRVRTRAVLNYFVANADNRVVLGTGNRTEAMTGYYTKYGDQAVDCNPIGGLYKQQVRQLAAAIGVPADLVQKPPTAEMWAGQTDEDELGVGYDHVDAILALHVDGPLSKTATLRVLADEGVTEAHVDRVVDLYERSEHKRHMPPAPDLPI
jgi:NAD+ synthase